MKILKKMLKISVEKILEKQDLEVLKWIIEENNNDIKILGDNDKSLLHLAIEKKWEKDTVNYLIEKGVDVNAKDKNGSTPLHYAAKMANLKVVKLLIEHGADIIENIFYNQLTWI